jgi:hypothetical protein
MAYDSVRQRVVMFGGETTGSGVLGDTWEFNGATANWALRTSTGPSARRNAALAYDPIRQVTVLFGGDDGVNDLSDTWEWNGTSWTVRTPAANPSVRAGAVGTWDPVRQRVVLFGGRAGTTTYFSDVYEYDGATWTLRTGLGTGPSARSGAGLAYDTARARLVMSCGQPESTNCDTWELGTTWTRITTTLSPGSRHYPGYAFHAARGRTVLTCGTSGGTTAAASSFEFDGTAWTANASNPTIRGWVTMAYDSTRGKMVLFGGYGGSAYLGDTWEF